MVVLFDACLYCKRKYMPFSILTSFSGPRKGGFFGRRGGGGGGFRGGGGGGGGFRGGGGGRYREECDEGGQNGFASVFQAASDVPARIPIDWNHIRENKDKYEELKWKGEAWFIVTSVHTRY